MALDLTAKTLENLKPGATRREVPDGKCRGLYFVLQTSGAASWAFRFRLAGTSKKLTLGPYPALGLAEARAQSDVARAAIAQKQDPASAKAADRKAAKEAKRAAAAGHDDDNVERIAGSFIEIYAKKKTRSWRETERLFKKEIFPTFGARRLSDITKRDVGALLDKIVRRGAPITSNRVLAAFRKCCNWAIGRDILAVNPCAGIEKRGEEKSRDRVLSEAELAALWRATEGIGYPFGPAVHLLVLTGARREEVGAMRWREIDFERRLWALPLERSKNKKPRAIPLSDDAIAILREVPRIEGQAGFVFSTTGRTSISGFSKAKRTLEAAMRDPDIAAAKVCAQPAGAGAHWVLHDIRRTVATGLQSLRVAVEVTESILGHTSGKLKGVAGVYQRGNFEDEKREALDAWALVVAGHAEGIFDGLPEGAKRDVRKGAVDFVAKLRGPPEAKREAFFGWVKDIADHHAGATVANVVEFAKARA